MLEIRMMKKLGKHYYITRVDFHFFSQEGWKNFRWGESYVQYAILAALGGALNVK